jgi:hypothetical protein
MWRLVGVPPGAFREPGPEGSAERGDFHPGLVEGQDLRACAREREVRIENKKLLKGKS